MQKSIHLFNATCQNLPIHLKKGILKAGGFMSKKRKKLLKYRDLPWELRGQVDWTYGHIQKAQNPTVRHILERLKRWEKMYTEEGANVSAQEKRTAIDKLENYIHSAEL